MKKNIVRADHPVLKRIDETFNTIDEAYCFIIEIGDLGYENIELVAYLPVKIHDIDVKITLDLD